jgi:hypothetical protein
MICIVRGIGESHHKYLVDVGSGYPMFETVPIHDLPKTFHQTALKIKYTQSETPGRFTRWHRKRDSVVVKDEVNIFIIISAHGMQLQRDYPNRIVLKLLVRKATSK